MNEITNIVKVADAAYKTVRMMDALKKTVAVAAVVACGIMIIRLSRK